VLQIKAIVKIFIYAGKGDDFNRIVVSDARWQKNWANGHCESKKYQISSLFTKVVGKNKEIRKREYLTRFN